MPRRHRVLRLGSGIVRDGAALIGTVSVGSSRAGTLTRQRKRFPLGTDLAKIRAWQHGAKYTLATTAPSAPGRGTLAADIRAFIAALPEGRYRIDTEDLLAHWTKSPLGDRDRRTITRLEIIGVISAWTTAGAAESTCNQRLSRLRKVFQALDGLDGNPTDGIARLRSPKAEPRDIPSHIVQLILDSLPDRGRAERGETRPMVSHTKLRLRVMAWTGIAPATLRRVRPRDLELSHGRVYLRPRRKGKGTHGAWVTLLPFAVDAFRDFAAAGLFERAWSGSSVWKTWRVAIARATAAADRVAAETGDRSWADDLASLPPRCHPYDLRHAFASKIYRETGDIGAVSELLQHASLETTKRYTRGAVSERVAAAIAKTAAAHATMPTIPPPVAPKAAPRLRLVQRAGS